MKCENEIISIIRNVFVHVTFIDSDINFKILEERF